MSESEKIDYKLLAEKLEKENLETSYLIQNMVENAMGFQLKMEELLNEFENAKRSDKKELAQENYLSVLQDGLKICARIDESRIYSRGASKEFYLDIEKSSNEIKAAVILNKYIKTKQECKDKGISCGDNMRETFLSEQFKDDARKLKVDLNKLDEPAKKKIMKVVNRDMKGGTPPTPEF